MRLRAVFVIAVLAAMNWTRLFAQEATPLITGSINESSRVTLVGNTRPEAKISKYDRGALSDTWPVHHIQLLLRRPPEHEAQLQTVMSEQSNPRSALFHHWLTPQEIGNRFGAARSDVRSITSWLKAHGFRINVTYPGGLLIDFSGTAGQVRATFGTEMHLLDAGGRTHIANVEDPKVPTAIAPAVEGIVSLNDFRPAPTSTPISNFTSDGCTDPKGQTTKCYEISPADLWKIYNFPKLTNKNAGHRATIGLIEDSDVNQSSDWTTFRSNFDLARFTNGWLAQVHPSPPDGGTNCADPSVNDDAIEAITDAEWASAAAPDAGIVLLSCASTGLIDVTPGTLIALENAIYSFRVPFMSVSYGACEKALGNGLNSAFYSVFETLEMEGISVFVSTGDSGAAQCDRTNPPRQAAKTGISVSGYATTPFAVAVGGTDFGDTFDGRNPEYWNSINSKILGSAKSYIPEIPWNASCASSLLATYVLAESIDAPNALCVSKSGVPFLQMVAAAGGPSSCVQQTIFGGCTEGYPKPDWQTVSGNPNDKVRDIPDVSLFAGSGTWLHSYIICATSKTKTCGSKPSSWYLIGGTSVSTPIWAGIQALAYDAQYSFEASWQGNPAPAYYSLAEDEYGKAGSSLCVSSDTADDSCVFYDIARGDIGIDCVGQRDCYYGPTGGTYGVLSTSTNVYKAAYASKVGWDFATGIGTPNVSNLINMWPIGSCEAFYKRLGGFRTTPEVSHNPLEIVPFGQTNTITQAIRILSCDTLGYTIQIRISSGSCDTNGVKCSLNKSTVIVPPRGLGLLKVTFTTSPSTPPGTYGAGVNYYGGGGSTGFSWGAFKVQ